MTPLRSFRWVTWRDEILGEGRERRRGRGGIEGEEGETDGGVGGIEGQEGWMEGWMGVLKERTGGWRGGGIEGMNRVNLRIKPSQVTP